MTPHWQVLIPVKSLSGAKTRIDLPSQARAQLALAMCMDVISAVIDVPAVSRVDVITADANVIAAARGLGTDGWWVPGVRGLNQELSAAARVIGKGHGVAVVMADLPCLTADLVTDILDQAPTERASFVPDAEDRGTTMFLTPPLVRVAPRFGHQSAAAHGAIAKPLRGDQSWLAARRDVDTIHDLAWAACFGLGAFTKSWEGLASAISLADATPWGSGAEVQPIGGQAAGQRVAGVVL